MVPSRLLNALHRWVDLIYTTTLWGRCSFSERASLICPHLPAASSASSPCGPVAVDEGHHSQAPGESAWLCAFLLFSFVGDADRLLHIQIEDSLEASITPFLRLLCHFIGKGHSLARPQPACARGAERAVAPRTYCCRWLPALRRKRAGLSTVQNLVRQAVYCYHIFQMEKRWLQVPKPHSQCSLVVVHIQATQPLSAPRCLLGMVLPSLPGEVSQWLTFLGRKHR